MERVPDNYTPPDNPDNYALLGMLCQIVRENTGIVLTPGQINSTAFLADIVPKRDDQVVILLDMEESRGDEFPDSLFDRALTPLCFTPLRVKELLDLLPTNLKNERYFCHL